MPNAWDETPNDEASYGLIVPFLTDDPKFTLGVEVGIIYERMRRGDEAVESTVHAINDEQLLLMARRLGYDCVLESLAEGWSTIVCTKHA